uniref:N-acetyltransferase domain-containing protein n=1 Tax=Rhabditophanes sp. KR3021 TaxID=114890 RepID=A0AC35U061_9BILA
MVTLPFNVLITPEDPKYHEKFYKSAFNVSGWSKPPTDYNVWRTAFGEDYVYLVAVDKETEVHIGSVGGCFYRNNAGKKVIFCIGGYYIFPEYRGQGKGKLLFDVILDIAKKEDVNIYLNCNENMKNIYCSIGIDIVRKNSIIVYRPKFNHFNFDGAVVNENSTLKDAKECLDWDQVKQFDQKIVGDINRLNYIKTRLIQPSSHSIISYNKETNKVNGFINAHEAVGGPLILGPLYADSDQIAEQLFISLFKKMSDLKVDKEDILIFTFQYNEFMSSMLKKYTNGREEKISEQTSHFSKLDIQVKTEFVYCFFETALSFV